VRATLYPGVTLLEHDVLRDFVQSLLMEHHFYHLAISFNDTYLLKLKQRR
jgi:hypothetical protein